MAKWVAEYNSEHTGAGKIGCQCGYCEKFENFSGFGSRCSDLELDLLQKFYVMGDDFVGVALYPEFFNAVIDGVFGTTTKNLVKQSFSSNLKAPEGVEFLKNTFFWTPVVAHSISGVLGLVQELQKHISRSDRYITREQCLLT